MQDRFKLRAWSEEDKEMISWEELEEDSDVLDRQIWNVLNEDHYKCMQCTGLKDKNGKLIYEGDVLSDDTGNIFKVFYHDLGFEFLTTDDRNLYYEINISDGHYEIIGNIFETPYLFQIN